MMVMVPCGVSDARQLAMANVPAANLSNSKTPAGPFQMTVLQSLLWGGGWVLFDGGACC
jgi:hypothetical protein